MHRSAASIALLAVASTLASSCSSERPVFSEQNARAHVNRLAGAIGGRPAGSDANSRARAYIIEQLKQAGFDVRVQTSDARRRDLGRTARVSNIIAVLAGQRREAIGLLSHYDSVPEAPGAADNALGVAVSLEAARVVASRADRQWSMLILITDAEESGLMGAAALVDDREITDRLKTYINIEAIGSSGVPVLFEDGPGNGWLTAVWARSAPNPRGGSYGIEVYKRLPNDTDFSIIKTLGIPGLNFAAVEDSYAYHTPRDTPERLSPRTIQTLGENAVAIVQGLQRVDITRRSDGDHTFFDVAGRLGVSYGPAVSTTMGGVALLLGFFAWGRVMRAVLQTGSIWRWLLVALWTIAAGAAVAGAMTGMVALLRAAREVYHPWYAYPGRLFALLLATGVTAGWAMARLGRLLPAGAARALRHPATTWSLALPVWLVLAVLTMWVAPSAAYLWTLPLLSAGVLLVAAPPSRDGIVRAASVAILAVTGTLWVSESLELMRFMVAVMGRLPIVTPVYVYPAVLCAAGLMIAPPLIAALAPGRPLFRPPLVTALLLLATVVFAGLTYAAPAYTYERPLRRYARAIQEPNVDQAIWEVGSVEPGIDLGQGAPAGFAPGTGAPAVSVPWGRLNFPFVFRATGAALGPPPASVTSFATTRLGDGSEASITVIPHRPALIVSFVLPPDVVPARTNLPGIMRAGRWTATFVAPPVEGVSWRASFGRVPPATLDGIRVVATVPWDQHPPDWLPQDRSVWSGSATWVLGMPAAIAVSAALR